MSDFFGDDDRMEEGFEGYVVNTVDPGPWLLIGTILVSIGLYALLPCLMRIFPPPPPPRRLSHETVSVELSRQPPRHDRDKEFESLKVPMVFVAAATDDDHDDSEVVVGPQSAATHHDSDDDDKPNRIKSNCCDKNNLLEIAEWNTESKRLHRLALAFGSEALVVGILENARVAILGHLVGTPELSTYVLVSLLVGLTTDFVGGFYSSLATLLSHSIGAKHDKLTGQYVQLSIWLFVLFSLPFVVMWIFIMEDTLLFLGLDAPTARMGQQFTKTFVFATLLDGVGTSILELFQTTGYEITSAVQAIVDEVITTVAILVYALYWEEP